MRDDEIPQGVLPRSAISVHAPRVVAFPGIISSDKPGYAQPQADVIEMAEKLLDGARSGEIQAVAFCAVTDDGDLLRGWKGSACTDLLMASIVYLKSAFAHAVNRHQFESTDTWRPRGPA
jgi:hypothetical protein